MFTPRSHTYPTKFPTTLATRHMITSSILFNRGITPGTFLCIGRNPVCSFGIVFAFLEPFFDERTETGLMVLQAAAKTEGMSAAATNSGDDVI